MKLKYSPFPQEEKTPINTWFLGVCWTSGDGDHDEKVHYKFKSEAEFIKAIEIFKSVKDLYPGENTKKIRNILYDNLKIDVEWDVTSDQFCAQPSLSQHHYFDENGMKKQVEIEVS